MYRTLPYLLLFIVVILFQVFFFDNLSISIYLNPLVYIAFILLLPLDILPVVLLLAGFVTGVVMDYLMGAAGVNTIATLFIAFVRPTVLNILYNRDDIKDGGVPSAERLGNNVFWSYLAIMVVTHHLIFFSLETLSWTHIARILLCTAFSSAVSILFVWLIARLFTAKLPSRI